MVWWSSSIIICHYNPKTLFGSDEEMSEDVVGDGSGEGSSWSDRTDEMSCCSDGRGAGKAIP
jgi:hypothetical protein